MTCLELYFVMFSFQHLQALDYLDCPDYDYLVQLLDQVIDLSFMFLFLNLVDISWAEGLPNRLHMIGSR